MCLSSSFNSCLLTLTHRFEPLLTINLVSPAFILSKGVLLTKSLFFNNSEAAFSFVDSIFFVFCFSTLYAFETDISLFGFEPYYTPFTPFSKDVPVSLYHRSIDRMRVLETRSPLSADHAQLFNSPKKLS